jgi:hypothetical protein
MKPNDLILHCLGRKEGDQWIVMSLEFSLVAQADTLEEAQERLHSQITDYLTDALVGQDREHAAELLARRAPLKYRLIYWAARSVAHVRSLRIVRTFREPMPLTPAHA